MWGADVSKETLPTLSPALHDTELLLHAPWSLLRIYVFAEFFVVSYQGKTEEMR